MTSNVKSYMMLVEALDMLEGHPEYTIQEREQLLNRMNFFWQRCFRFEHGLINDNYVHLQKFKNFDFVYSFMGR